VTDSFQDGRRRHDGNSSACYKMGNYHPILMKISTQTKKNMPSSKITKGEGYANFQDGRCRHVGNSSECYKMGSCHLISTKIGTQTKKSTLSWVQKSSKRKCMAIFKMATLAILEIQVRSRKWAIIGLFNEVWYTD
jgi:hypothetical protein